MHQLFDNRFGSDRPAAAVFQCRRVTAAACWRGFVLAICLMAFFGVLATRDGVGAESVSEDDFALVQLDVIENKNQRRLTGRVIVEAQDGGLLFEERNGRIHSVTPDMLQARTQLNARFAGLNAKQLSDDLLQTMGDGFEVTVTDHYVICSNSSPEYATFCGRLLEKVYEQFFEFLTADSRPFVRPPQSPLPVIVFATSEQLKQFAAKQHPDVSFDDTPGYYSVRDNQILITDLSGEGRRTSTSSIRRKLLTVPRQVATVVHEATHQLAFNSGVQVRMADNPLWLSEGLAMWFEPTSSRSPLLWSRPGLVNPLHQPLFLTFVQEDRLRLPLKDLISSDEAFKNTESVAAAYSESWALTAWLIRQHPEAMDQLLKSMSERRPLQRVSADQKIAEFQQATGKSLDEIESSVIPYISRLRVPRQ